MTPQELCAGVTLPLIIGLSVTFINSQIDSTQQFNPSDIEIAEVVEIPITELLAVKNQYVETRWDGVESIDSISYGYDRYLIYGATATILSQFLDVISNNFSLEVQVD